MGASAWDQSTTAASNTSIGGVNQSEGCAPSTLNNATRALAAQTLGALIGVTATGTDTYVATLAPAPDALTDGMTVHIRFTNSNATTTPTLNINSLGAETIVKEGSAALVAGDIPAGHEGDLRYNGTNWVLLNPKVNGAALTGSANTFTADQTIQSAVADATVGPVLTLDRNSASPAASDLLGKIVFQGRDSGGGSAPYAAIYANIQDTTDASEDGALVFQTAQAGTATIAGYFQTGLVVGTPTGLDKGLGTVNATALYQNGTAIAALSSALQGIAIFSMSGGVITQNFYYNVSSVTRSATGKFTVTLTTAMASATKIGAVGSAFNSSNNVAVMMSDTTAPTASTVSMQCLSGGGAGTQVDASYVCVMIFGQQ